MVCYNLGQKVVDKLTKLSKIGFSMECFTDGFLRFFVSLWQSVKLCITFKSKKQGKK